MSATWCAARVAEIRGHVNTPGAEADRTQYRTWLIELLSQIDRPPQLDTPIANRLIEHLTMLEATTETTPGNEALAADYRVMLREMDRLDTALATTTEQLAAARQELGEQEVQQLALVQGAMPPADPVLAALQLLSDRFYEVGAMGAFEAIEDAAHQAGYCLASDSPTECDWSWCRHCDWGNQSESEAPAAPAQVAVAPPVALVEDEREIIGTYETSRLPVYEGDDYVTDVEGCYLTRAEANELLEDEKVGGGLPLERGADAPEAGKERAGE